MIPLRRAFAGFLCAAAVCRADIRVTNLRCDWGVNPVGIDSAPPRLSWQLASVERGARQTAWEVQAASSPGKLRRGPADLWDSGRIPGGTQLEVRYGGPALRTAEQVFWRVRAWDSDAKPSAWSAVGNWTMGVVCPDDWLAKWITDSELLRLIRPKLGFSTPPVPNPDTPEWIALDLGRSFRIQSIILDALVHGVPERLGFPRWFRIEVSENANFKDATVIADHAKTGINVWLTRFKVAGEGTEARYIRLTATRLRMVREEDSSQPVGRLALRQIEVYSGGRNVALNAKVSSSASLETGRWSAASVVDGLEVPGANPRAAGTLLERRDFFARQSPRRAILFVTGLGSCTVSIDGVSVGAGNLLEPGWTDTRRTCLYETYDVTHLVRRGANAVGLTLAGGMYNVPDVPGHYTKFVSAFRPLIGLAQLRLEYPDGTVETVATDAAWKVAAGPTTFAHVYGGEDYDARREPAGWDSPGFDDSTWRRAAVVPGPGGALRGYSEAAPPIRAEATLPPISVRVLRPGVAVYDLGQNAALMPRMRVHGAEGSAVRIIPAELLHPDGSIDPGSTRPSNADASWRYTLRGGVEESWIPRFFYYGARYLQVECAAPAGKPLPVVDSLEGVVVHSDSAVAGTFSCSNELFNRIAALVRWAQASNMASVLTDCPHRERLGWLEQYHLNGPSLRYDFDLTRLYAKGLHDMADAQRPDGCVPDIAPAYVWMDGGFRDSPEWGSAFILSAWQQYVWTGDDVSLEKHYDAMRRYFAYLGTRAKEHILSFGLGDWYDLGPQPPGVAQLTPIALTATAVYYQDALTLERIASVVGRADEAGRFARQAEEIRASFNRRFFNSRTGNYATGSQTSNAMPLVLGMVPPGGAPRVVANLVNDVRAHGNALTAGDVGYRYLLRALADAGRSDVVFDMNDQTRRPGYGFQIAHGATSLTEAWDANRHSSQDHFMLGQIIEWFCRDVAGLAPDADSPGFGRVVVRPCPVGDLLWARVRYDSVRGPFEVRWRRATSRFWLELEIPANAGATVELPAADADSITEGGRPISAAPGVSRIAAVRGRPSFRVESGHYHFECRL